MKPSDKQIQEFWELCGLKQVKVRARTFEILRGKKHSWETCEWRWLMPNCEFEDKLYPSYHGVPFVLWNLPRIDLNNLFQYAVPKLRDLSESNTLQDIEFHWQGLNISDLVECNIILDNNEFSYEDNDPALALFWATYKALGGKEC